MLSWKQDGNGKYTTYNYTLRDELAQMTYADGSSESWTYDPQGNLGSHTDANGKLVTYDYYDHNLLQHINYPHDPQVTFTYDAAGLQKTMTDATGLTTYQYDGANNVTQIASPNGTVSYQYDAADRRHIMTLAGTGDTVYEYDPADRLTSVTNPFNEQTTYTYDNADRLRFQTNADGTRTQTDYDAQDRVTSVKHQSASNITQFLTNYGYNLAGNVKTRLDVNFLTNARLSVTYGYDYSDQLISEKGVDGNLQPVYSRTYTYDHAQNRTSVLHDGVTDSYSYYPNSNRLQSAGNRSYTYDTAGNCTQLKINGIAQQNFTYDDENRVSQIDYPSAPALPSSHFGYNGQRLRTSRQDSHGLAKYVTDGDSPGADVLSDGQAIYTPGISERRNGTTRFLKLDDTGSLRGQTTSAWGNSGFLTQDAFGNTMQQSGTLTGSFGFEADAQYQTDGDSGLLLVGNRYYDPAIGRFLQPDPSGEEDNEYAYADNNPLSFDDPDGLHYGPQNKKGNHTSRAKKQSGNKTDGKRPAPPKPVKKKPAPAKPPTPPVDPKQQYRAWWPKKIPIDVGPNKVTVGGGGSVGAAKADAKVELGGPHTIDIDGPAFWAALSPATRATLDTIGKLQKYIQDHEGQR